METIEVQKFPLMGSNMQFDMVSFKDFRYQDPVGYKSLYFNRYLKYF